MLTRGNRPLVRLENEVLHETASAVCINNGEKDVWIPKSQMIEGKDEDQIYFLIPEWLAIKEGLV